VIRRIFDMAATGAGVRRIAATLNAEGVLAPMPRRSVRPGTWAAGSVRDVLHRQLYRGYQVWNRRGRDRAAGRTWRRPEGEWITSEAPELRIIPEELWRTVHEQLAASRAAYLKRTAGQVYGRPVNGVESAYLLTGLASCGAFGGSLFMHTRQYRQTRRPFYACVVYHQRGRAICKNNLETPMETTDQAVLAAIERDVLRVEVLETSLYKALELARPKADSPSRAGREELARLDAEIARLAAAIAAGGELAGLLAALQERERRRAALRTELAASARTSSASFDVEAILDSFREQLADWRGMLRQEVPAARQALRALLGGRLVFTPRERDGARFYEFEGPGTVSKVIAGLALPTGVVSP
jgi:site-specific DNA recombinase